MSGEHVKSASRTTVFQSADYHIGRDDGEKGLEGDVAQILTHEWASDHALVFKLDASSWTGSADDVLRKAVAFRKDKSLVTEAEIAYAGMNVASLMLHFEGAAINRWLDMKRTLT